MTIYFSSSNIKSLNNYDLKQRQTLLQAAEHKLDTPQKLLLNLVKLGILVPMFLYVVWLTNWGMILPIILAIFSYFLIYRPLFLFFLQKHLNKVIQTYDKSISDSK